VRGIPVGADQPREFWEHHGVAQRGSIPVALILLVLVLLGATVAIVVPVAGVPVVGSSAGPRVAEATVVDPAPCGVSTPGDLVEVPVNGVRTQARLDGCGHLKGERLQVEVPATAPPPNLVVRIYTPAAASTGGSTSSRLNWVLLTLAAIAGGGYMLLLRSRSAPADTAARNDGPSAHLG
jgi:hypothetical protein